ncbi:Adenosine receptor A2b, partial [Lamellibrachia satsuma]
MNTSAGNGTNELTEVSAFRPEMVPFAFAYGVFVIVGNGLTITSVLRFEQLRTPANLFVASLAGADLAVGVTGPYFIFLNSVPMGVRLSRNSDIACLFSLWGIILSTVGSAFNLLAIAIDRFIAIMFPLRYASIVSPTTAKAWIAVVWAVIFCLSLPPFCGWNTWSRKSRCTFTEVLHAEYTIGLFAVPVVTCLVVLTVLYCVVFAVAWKHQRQIQAS